MTLSEFKNYFKTELSDRYTVSECEELFYIFSQKILGKDKFEIRRIENENLDINRQSALYNHLMQLKLGKPYQQILGEADFFGMTFFVNEHVLIPRPETEELVEMAIGTIRDAGRRRQPSSNNHQSTTNNHQPTTILDIGTGSGIIPIVLKKHFPDAEISAIDLSEKALEVARRNAARNNVDIHFIKADYLNLELSQTYDIIISNPPYIGTDEEAEIADSVKDFEPNIALFSPVSDSLVFYRKMAKDAEKNLNDDGMIFLEINQKYGRETLDLFAGFTEVALVKDLSGNDRFVYARK